MLSTLKIYRKKGILVEGILCFKPRSMFQHGSDVEPVTLRNMPFDRAYKLKAQTICVLLSAHTVFTGEQILLQSTWTIP